MSTVMLPSVEARAQSLTEELFQYLTVQGSRSYGEARVTQLEHALQAAQLAREAGADDDAVVAALLHDIGQFIPMYEHMPALIAPNGSRVGRGSHDVFGEKYLRELGFNDKICQLVGAHVMAKRYLTAVDKDYYDKLTEISKNSLRLQGGVFTEEEVKFHQKDPLLEQKLALRRFDDLAKVPGKVTEPLSQYKPLVVKTLIDSLSRAALPHQSDVSSASG
ncbi:hypothetical protein UA08_01849 [Talaromyces atroroseus]|uniref:HD domain-containing protein n=1 Tax=Talaromyces atroroseus TaxID=1441469 RepID=A0A1Q5QA78_TALAT|nr:hypothetical protein UA08_01849 [Talaromyces atroroseus]OKL62791.1 hypothetical protein UA08_01849 [Talaromyces atroroseus]